MQTSSVRTAARHVMRAMPPLLLCLLLAATISWGDDPGDGIARRLHTFYYPWYGTVAVDGQVHGWRSPSESGTTFNPKLSPYSTNDPEVLDAHMRMMQRAGIGVLCTSWWGIGHYTDKAVPRLLDAAAKHGIAVNFHLEPFEGRDAASIRRAIEYIIDTYGSHPAFYRYDDGRPLFYLYDAYKSPAREWAKLLSPDGGLSIRGTAYDSVVISLWVCKHHEDRYMLEGHFDGFYTYFAADGFVYGSTTRNWPRMMKFARENDLIFIPCVGPGYDDTCVRTWNTENLRTRDLGMYYSGMFTAAIGVDPPIIGVTSFNEWFEGTQIEPAVPLRSELFTYNDYEPLRPEFYLDHTRFWAGEWSKARRGEFWGDPR